MRKTAIRWVSFCTGMPMALGLGCAVDGTSDATAAASSAALSAATCSTSLAATLFFHSSTRVDGTVTLPQGSPLLVPSAIAVTAGSTKNGHALLAFGQSGGSTVRCTYAIHGGGSSFALVGCDSGATAGAIESADSVSLHIQNADHGTGTTSDELQLTATLNAPDSTLCDDGNACTQSDSCKAGVCVGAKPVVCTASDQCHATGTCDPSGGQCSNPNQQDGTACTVDGGTGTCQAGACTGGGCTGMGTWSARAPMPQAAHGMAVASLNGKVYVIGGYNGGALGNNRVYDPVADSWANLAPMITPREFTGSNGAVASGRIYAVGGNASGYCTNANEVYDPATNTWASSAPMPTPRCHLSVVAANGRIYAMGGSNTSGSVWYQTVEAYDPASDSWTTAAPMPTGRSNFAAGVINGKIYAVGGSNLTIINPGQLNTTEAYDPVMNTWTTLSPMPTPRGGLAAGEINGLLYAVGGFASTFTATVEAYDPATNAWSSRSSMPTARVSMGAGVVGNILYAVGGYNAAPELAANEAFLPCATQ